MLLLVLPMVAYKRLHPFPSGERFLFLGVYRVCLVVMYVRHLNYEYLLGFRLLLVLRALLGFASIALQVYSVKHMPFADAITITATSSTFAAIFGRIFAK